MNIIFLIYLLFLLVWFGGVAVGVYHVLKYRIPGDYSTVALWLFLAVAAITFLIAIYFVSGLEWGI
jgi:hypothetical protein